ncbi:hypothetical protein F2Q70_00009430 [Brassica cretica]|uniref:HMA domain-containing protein n=1 Tax=Brassica cretica TaxID=69181 RepID=A0A8S9LSF5_BRACR|nr:hypothetical protein F2Q70_00009430 [Brassica cretica]
MGTLLGDLSMVTKLTSMWKERLSEWSVGSGSLRETAPQEYEEAASMAVFRIVGMTCSACDEDMATCLAKRVEAMVPEPRTKAPPP